VNVVLSCGGQGLRMRAASEVAPKPMILVGGRPNLWHVMQYYAYFGHREFMICVGYKGEVIEDFFPTYEEEDARDWDISFVDTGTHASVGERLGAVRDRLAGEERFLANYGDVVTDAHLPTLIERAMAAGATASFLCVRPNYSFHVVSADVDGQVSSITDALRSDIWINGGYFILRADFLEHLRPGEEIIEEPFQRAVRADQVQAQRHEGFWAPMDTLKDNQWLERLHETGRTPWRVWDPPPVRDIVSVSVAPLG